MMIVTVDAVTFSTALLALGALGSSAGGSSVDDAIERLENVAAIPSDSLRNVLAKSVLLPIVAFAASAAGLISAALDVPILTLGAIGESLAELASALIGGPARILDAGVAKSVQGFFVGVWDQFGPFTFVIAVVVVLVAAFLVARFLEEDETSNVLPFAPFDLPRWLGGAEEEGDD